MPDLDTYDWSEVITATAPAARRGAGFVWAGDRAILFGGLYMVTPSGPAAGYADTWQFDSSTLQWTQLSPSTAPHDRSFPVMVWDGADTIYLWGGVNQYELVSPFFENVNDTWKFDLTTDEWTQLSPAASTTLPLQHADVGHVGYWDTTTNRFVLKMAHKTTGGGAVDRNETWSFNPATPTWTDLAPSPNMSLDVTSGTPDPNPRGLWGQAGCWNDVDDVFIVQGGDWSTDRSTAATWEFDPSGPSWTQVAGEGVDSNEPSTHRTYHQMVWAGDRAFLFGGSESTIGSVGNNTSNVNWNYVAGTWTILSPATVPPERMYHSMVWDGSCAIMFGGFDDAGAELGDTWMFCGPPAERVIHLRGIATP